MERAGTVIVVGGGASGVATAVAAARRGVPTILLERSHLLGGMATLSEVRTICGLFHRSALGPELVSQGFEAEFASYFSTPPLGWESGLWFVPYEPTVFLEVCTKLLGEAGVELRQSSRVTRVAAYEDRVSEVEVTVDGRSEVLFPSAVVDCTGNGTVSKLLGLPLITASEYQAGALVFQLRSTEELSLEEVQKRVFLLILRGCESGQLPEELKRVSIIPGSFSHGVLSLKLSLPHLIDGSDPLLIEQEARGWIGAFDALLRNEGAPLRVLSIAQQIGVRSEERALGEYLLTGDDVLSGTVFPDWVARGAWPSERWGWERKPVMEYLPERAVFTIPARSLSSPHLKNLFFAGRNLSSDERALGAARVIGTCLGTGFAAGSLAAALTRGESRTACIATLQQYVAPCA